jgi:tRNA A-37 threonylcarbamoyl transferase component Bud32
MAEERKCSQCGGSLPADAPQGLCPQCLMKLGLPTEIQPGKSETQNQQNGIQTDATPPAGFVPPAPSELAEQFPQLEIMELLGQGGMGAVYKARQKHLDRLVALKILSPQIGRMEAFAERFAREARSLAKLNHPGIVAIYDFGHTQSGLYYFVMEFIDGTDLRQILRAGHFSPAEALAIVPKLCETLQYAHEEGVVHRDIKPENILISKKGQVKIADFGLARLVGRPAEIYTLTQTGQKMGTPHYMAPEQIEQPHQVDHRADIYSLGVVFYEMLTGELPLGRFPLPSRKVHIDVRLDEVVLKTLEKEPQLRYQHASEIKTAVETIVSTGPAEKVIPSEAIENARRAVRIPAIGLLVAAGINSLFILAGPNRNPILMLFAIAQTVFIILGAFNLMQLRSYRLAFTGSILAMLPYAGVIVGLPMGIWTLVIITKESIKTTFKEKPNEKIIPPKVFEAVASATDQANNAFNRGVTEVEKIISPDKVNQVQPSGISAARGQAILSLVLAIISLILIGNGTRSSLLALVPAIFAIYLGAKTIKVCGVVKGHKFDKILAIIGIAIASISAFHIFEIKF